MDFRSGVGGEGIVEIFNFFSQKYHSILYGICQLSNLKMFNNSQIPFLF